MKLIDLDTLRSIGSSGSALLDRVITRFVEEGPDLDAELRQAVHSGNPAETRRIAHILRGRSAMIGAVPLARACKCIEDNPDAVEWLSEIHRFLLETSAELLEFRERADVYLDQPEAGPGGTLDRLLLVDDDALQRAITRAVLMDIEGCSVLECSSGEEALEAAPDFLPQVVLMDLHLPGIDGIETTRQLASSSASCESVVIAMTASLNQAEYAQAIEAGAADIVEKPYDPADLIGRIMSVWNRRSRK